MLWEREWRSELLADLHPCAPIQGRKLNPCASSIPDRNYYFFYFCARKIAHAARSSYAALSVCASSNPAHNFAFFLFLRIQKCAQRTHAPVRIPTLIRHFFIFAPSAHCRGRSRHNLDSTFFWTAQWAGGGDSEFSGDRFWQNPISYAIALEEGVV